MKKRKNSIQKLETKINLTEDEKNETRTQQTGFSCT